MPGLPLEDIFGAAGKRGTFLLRSSRPAAGEVVWAAVRDIFRREVVFFRWGAFGERSKLGRVRGFV